MNQEKKFQVAEISLLDLLGAIDATQPTDSSKEGSTLRRIRKYLQMKYQCGQVTLGSIASTRTEAETLGMITKSGYLHELSDSGIVKLEVHGLRRKIAA